MLFDIKYEIWDVETEKTDEGVMTVDAIDEQRAKDWVTHKLEETYEEGSQLLSLETVTYQSRENG